MADDALILAAAVPERRARATKKRSPMTAPLAPNTCTLHNAPLVTPIGVCSHRSVALLNRDLARREALNWFGLRCGLWVRRVSRKVCREVKQYSDRAAL